MIERKPTMLEAIKQSVEMGRAMHEGAILIPKQARIIDVDPKFAHLFPPRGSQYTLEGEGFNDLNPRRTVFLEQPVIIGNTNYYLEVKGYGRSGKELHAAKHDEGDLNFGTYIDTVAKEFYFPRMLREKGITNIQQPVALFMFRESDFIKYAMQGLEIRLAGRLPFDPEVRSGIEKLLPDKIDNSGQFGDINYDSLAKAATEQIQIAYNEGGKNGLERLAHEVGLDTDLAGVIDYREAGYMLRAVKSPIRVGSHIVVSNEDREIALSMGKTIRQMLELGYLDTSPHPDNWTTKGELVDFANVCRYPRDIQEIREIMKFFKTELLSDLLRFAFGKATLGPFEADFQRGFMEKDTNIDDVVSESMQILQKLKDEWFEI